MLLKERGLHLRKQYAKYLEKLSTYSQGWFPPLNPETLCRMVYETMFASPFIQSINQLIIKVMPSQYLPHV